MATKRAKNVDDKIIEEIVGILDGWTSKLTWELLIEAVAKRLRCTYSRQALHEHERILSAFQLRKKTLAARQGKSPKPAAQRSIEEVELLIARNERLAAENARLNAENMRLLEQFTLWAYNAHMRGLTKEFLSQPLPAIDREPSKLAAVTLSCKKAASSISKRAGASRKGA